MSSPFIVCFFFIFIFCLKQNSFLFFCIWSLCLPGCDWFLYSRLQSYRARIARQLLLPFCLRRRCLRWAGGRCAAAPPRSPSLQPAVPRAAAGDVGRGCHEGGGHFLSQASSLSSSFLNSSAIIPITAGSSRCHCVFISFGGAGSVTALDKNVNFWNVSETKLKPWKGLSVQPGLGWLLIWSKETKHILMV